MPFLSVKNDITDLVAPDEDVFTPFAKRAVQAAFGNPLVNRPYAQTEQIGELSRRENDGNFSRGASRKGMADFLLAESRRARAHTSAPELGDNGLPFTQRGIADFFQVWGPASERLTVMTRSWLGGQRSVQRIDFPPSPEWKAIRCSPLFSERRAW